MPEQLRHLVELSAQPTITIEIIRFDAGAHFGLTGPFTLLGFDNELGDVLYLEGARTGNLILADPASAERITDYHEAFEELRRISLGPEASRDFIIEVAEEMARDRSTRSTEAVAPPEK